MGKRQDLTSDTRMFILQLHELKLPMTEIARRLNISYASVKRVCKTKCIRTDGRKNCGRKRKSTAREDRHLIRTVKKNRFLSALQIKNSIHFTAYTLIKVSLVTH